MKKILSIKVNQDVFQKINQVSKKNGFTKSDLIRPLILNNLAFMDTNSFESYPVEIHENPDDYRLSTDGAYSLQSKNNGKSIFIDPSISNEYVINYCGSTYYLSDDIKEKISNFLKDKMGFSGENHQINWESPLVGLLVNLLIFNTQNN